MNSRKWYSILEDFFSDVHKNDGEEYSLEIDGEYYEYVVPEDSDIGWIRFCHRMLMGDDRDMSAREVCKVASEYGVEIPVEILEYQEQ